MRYTLITIVLLVLLTFSGMVSATSQGYQEEDSSFMLGPIVHEVYVHKVSKVVALEVAQVSRTSCSNSEHVHATSYKTITFHPAAFPLAFWLEDPGRTG